MKVHQNDIGDYVCEHGTATDVHCCNCHHGFLFDADSCVCDFSERTTGADFAVDPGASNVGKESLRASDSDLSETGVVGIAPPSPPVNEEEKN